MSLSPAVKYVLFNKKKFVGDLLSVKARACYSLRRMYSSYSGFLIRVRRSTDSTFLNIGFTSSGDLDTAALLAFANGGNALIQTIYDQSGHGFNQIQNSNVSQPPIVITGVLQTENGKPCISFDGVSHDLRAGVDSNVTGSISHSINAVAKVMANLTYSGSVSVGYGSTNVNATSVIGSTTGKYWYGGDDQVGFAGSNLLSSSVVLSKIYNGSSFSSYLNGGLDASGSVAFNLSSMFSTSYALGSYEFATYSAMRLSEAIVFLSALSTSDRQLLEKNQGLYYGVTVS